MLQIVTYNNTYNKQNSENFVKKESSKNYRNNKLCEYSYLFTILKHSVILCITS